MNEEQISHLFDLLLEMGAIEPWGFSDSGETIYKITPKCEEVFPEFWKMQMDMLGHTAFELWQLGLIEINFLDQTQTVFFREHNYRKYLELQDTLTVEQLEFMKVLLTN